MAGGDGGCRAADHKQVDSGGLEFKEPGGSSSQANRFLKGYARGHPRPSPTLSSPAARLEPYCSRWKQCEQCLALGARHSSGASSHAHAAREPLGSAVPKNMTRHWNGAPPAQEIPGKPVML
jgi:hypothetical protein